MKWMAVAVSGSFPVEWNFVRSCEYFSTVTWTQIDRMRFNFLVIIINSPLSYHQNNEHIEDLNGWPVQDESIINSSGWRRMTSFVSQKGHHHQIQILSRIDIMRRTKGKNDEKSFSSVSLSMLRSPFFPCCLYPYPIISIQSLSRPSWVIIILSCALSRRSGQWTNNRRGVGLCQEHVKGIILVCFSHHSTLLSSSSWLRALLSDKFLQSFPDNNGLCNTSKRQECQRKTAPFDSKSLCCCLG